MARKPKDKATTDQEYKAMYFAELYLENVKCFKKPVKLDLSDGNGKPAKWTVILGDNGTGKTTLLQGLTTMRPTDILPNPENERTLPFLFVKLPSTLKLIAPNEPISIGANFWIAEKGNQNEVLLTGHSNLLPKENNLINKAHYYSAYFVGSQFRGSGMGPLKSNISNMFLVTYGVMRTKAETLVTEDKEVDYLKNLAKNTQLINPEEWLLTFELQIKNSQNPIKKVLENRKVLIENILIKLLPEVSQIRNKEVKGELDRPGIEVQTPYGWIDIKNLSHGYQTITAWIVDLAARMFYHYPDSPNPLSEPAVVLVDEIDLHLHPKWQRTIMQDLSKHFPNVQFIVTAHSPLIVQSAPEGTNVVVLKRVDDHVEIINDPVSVRGWRVDQILASELFDVGTRGPEFDDILKRRNDLIHKPKLTKKETEELKEISDKIRREMRFDRDPSISLLLEEAAKYKKGKE